MTNKRIIKKIEVMQVKKNNKTVKPFTVTKFQFIINNLDTKIIRNNSVTKH